MVNLGGVAERPFPPQARRRYFSLAAYSLQALSFRLWYSTWVFPWLLLDEASADAALSFRLRAGLWFLLTVQLSVLIYGHLRTYLLGGSQLAAHLIGIPFVFGLPLLLAGRGHFMTQIAFSDAATKKDQGQ
ncbi:MAG: hypothetical protein R3D55_06520 [Chloroflexota bacterium]